MGRAWAMAHGVASGVGSRPTASQLVRYAAVCTYTHCIGELARIINKHHTYQERAAAVGILPVACGLTGRRAAAPRQRASEGRFT